MEHTTKGAELSADNQAPTFGNEQTSKQRGHEACLRAQWLPLFTRPLATLNGCGEPVISTRQCRQRGPAFPHGST